MKTTLFMTLLSLSSLALMSGCGQGKSGATLKVSSGFALSNSSFSGGLVIMGKMDEQNQFVIPVAFTAGSSESSVKIQLKKGKWRFSAVGWEGSEQLTGTTKCGTTEVDISQDSQNVDLTATTAGCSDPTFGTNYKTSDFKPLHLITCGTLYKNKSGQLVDATTPQGYCTVANVGEEYALHAKSARIEIPDWRMGKHAPGISTCFSSGSMGHFENAANPLSLPSKMPLKITLFKENGCTNGSLFNFFLNKGAEATYTQFDTAYNSVSAATNIFLPFNKLGRGKNSFFSLLPKFSCSGGDPCLSIPGIIPDSKDRIIDQGVQVVLLDNVTDNSTCSDYSFTATDITDFSYSDCRMEDNQLSIRTNFSYVGPAALIHVYKYAMTYTNISVTKHETYHAYINLFEIVGFGTIPNNNVKNSFQPLYRRHNGEEVENNGILNRASQFFAPNGPMAVLGNVICASGVNADSMISFVEEGETRVFRILLSDSAAAIPNYLCNDANRYVASCGNFQKKVKVLRQMPSSPVFQNESVMHFDCLRKIGMFESQENDSEGIDKELVYWNTNVAGQSRAESYSYYEELDNSVKKRIEARYVKIDQSAVNKLKVQKLSFNAHHNGSSYFATADGLDMYVDKSANIIDQSQIMVPGRNTMNYLDLFSGHFENILKKKHSSNKVTFAESANKNWVLRTTIDGECPSSKAMQILRYNRTDGTSVSFSIDLFGCENYYPFHHSLSINNNGHFIVGVMNGITPQVMLYDGTSYQPAVTDGGTVTGDKIFAYIFENGNAVIQWIEKITIEVRSSLYQRKWDNFETAGVAEKLIYGEDSLIIDSMETFSSALGKDGKVYTFVKGAHGYTLAVDSSFTPSSLNTIPSTEFPGPPDEIYHRPDTNGVTFFYRYYDDGTKIKPIAVTSTGHTSYTAEDFMNYPSRNEMCLDTELAEFSTRTGCSALTEQDVAKPIMPNFGRTLYDLNPSTFSNLFKSYSAFQAQ